MAHTWSVYLPPVRLVMRRLWGRPDPQAADELLVLARGAAMRCHLKPGQVLRVGQGQLWLTREGEPQDHVLGPGERWVAFEHVQVLLSALAPAGCQVWRCSQPPASMAEMNHHTS